MLRQPGEAWLYNTCSDIQGVLVARVSGRPLPEFLAERIFEPLGMTDTGFHVPAEKLDRLPPYHGPTAPIDDGLWTEPPIFPSGAGGLVSTLADWHRFGRMLLAEAAGCSRRESVRLMMTDHLTPSSGTPRRCSSREPAGASAARSPPTAATAGSAAPARPRTSRRRPARSGSCSRRSDGGADLDAAHARVLGVRLRRDAVTEEIVLEVDGRDLRSRARARCSSRSAARPSSTSSATTSPSPSRSCARPAAGRRCCSASRTAPRAARSSRSASRMRARVAADDGRQHAERDDVARARARRHGARGLGGEPRVPGLPRLAVPARPPRHRRRAAARPRPAAGRRLRRGAGGGGRGARACSTSSGSPATRRRPGTAASTSTSGSSRAGTPTRCAPPRSLPRGSSSAAAPT